MSSATYYTFVYEEHSFCTEFRTTTWVADYADLPTGMKSIKVGDIVVVQDGKPVRMEDCRVLRKEALKKYAFPFILEKGEAKWMASISMDPVTEEFIFFVEELDWHDLRVHRAASIPLFRQFVTHKLTGRVVSSTYNLILGLEVVSVEVKHDKKTETTTLTVGKRKVLKRGKLKNRSQFPLHLSVPEYAIKVMADLDAEGKKFLVNIHGRPFYAIPYKWEPSGKYNDQSISYLTK